MKRNIILFTALLTILTTRNGFTQLDLSGWWQSNLYLWESLQEEQYWNFYQGLQFRLASEKNDDLYLNTYFRVAYRDDLNKWEERFYNLYINQDIGNDFRLRLGRQFINHGVINGTMDAVQISGRFAKRLQIHAVGGLDAPLNRELDMLVRNEGNLFGIYGAYKFAARHNFDLSYFRKERNSAVYWEQAGATLVGYASNCLSYYARADMNLVTDRYQNLRGRLTYYKDRWSLSAEYNSQRARIYEDSFFNIFQVNPYNQIRGAFNYQIKGYDLGLQLLHTVYNVSEYYILFKDDKDFRAVGTIGHQKYGTFGLIFQTGSVADNIGYFFDLRYEFLPNLTARLYNSYFNYERATANISEDALSFMVGLGYKLKKRLIIDGELQRSSNNIYKSDLRGLMRLTYLFQI